ncbi:hypothetical protein GGR95_002856 [Sulfitobacter undariae]|uniref:DUF4868 domain-containing protein n=1 Tax=Sulfitobacter undariae TaxID=1563671 RepID=A0A7W6ECE4_9RHOB|nr:hypothetical protein [Sulfitobacter undariae]MBB3995204.1 hypothetical protein [Sulfitobacter undariae]
MPRSFFALCRVGEENVVRRIPLQAGVQAELEQLFDAQEAAFLNGRDEEVVFDGDWKPDRNQIMTLQDAGLVQPFLETLADGPAAYEVLDISQYGQAGIKAVFSHSEALEGRVLIQRFRTSQYLQKSGVTLVFNNNRFGKLAKQGFALDARLTAIVEGDTVKFHSFASLRTILTVQEHYHEATEQQVIDFSEHVNFHIENAALFDAAMDERSRKLIRGIALSDVLNQHDVTSIREKALSVGLDIGLQEGKLVLPGEKRRLKIILSFLEQSVYKGVFTDETFETNSKRAVQ